MPEYLPASIFFFSSSPFGPPAMSTNVGNPVTSATRAASGKSTHGGALTGDTHDRSRVSGPADPTPHTISSPTATTPSGVSILWSLFALGLILRGIARNERNLRYLGLAMFAIVAGKVFFSDLSRLDQFYRIIAFIVLGILVLSGSFVYLKYRETFALKGPADKEDVA